MFGVIMTCSILLSFVIGLDLWQSAVEIIFIGSVYLTGRKVIE